jgi:glycosyltransferase involved in cell wall biosynthesis
VTPPQRIRILYDISTLGFAHLYAQSRGGAYRVDLHLAEGLAGSEECDLLFCANHSTVAFHGCEAFLRNHERLGAVPLIAAPTAGGKVAFRAAASAAHHGVRRLFRTNIMPPAIRRVAGFVDRRLHTPVGTGEAVDIFHCSPSAPLPAVENGRTPQRFLTVWDFAFTRFPHLYGPSYRRYLVEALASLRPGDNVITNSNFVRGEVLAQGVASPDRIHVVPLAADRGRFYRCDDPAAIARVRRKYGIPDGPYVLGVNTPDVRKNVPHAIHAFARAALADEDAVGVFVLTGHQGPGSDEIAQAIRAHPELRERIILTGFVNDDDLAPLYTAASVFVYSSIYEGFGLPPLEAMQCGTPVITSNTSSLPEVVGDGGLMLAPDDLDGLARAILDIARNPDRRRDLQRRAAAQSSRFSWESSTAALLRAYRMALRQ